MNVRVGKSLNYLIGFAAVLLPAIHFYPTNKAFGGDWINHVWMVGYFGEHFRLEGCMPEAFNTTELAGLPYPVFYGYLLYPILGLASAGVGPQVAVRAGVLVLFAAQYLSVRQAFRRLGATGAFAAGVACVVLWATYALTNLYNRAALPEFFATGLLTCAVCGWFAVLQAASHGALWRRGLRVGLLYALAAGTHPPTALLSLPLLAVLLVPLALRTEGPSRPARLACLAAVGCLVVLVLAPWCYALHLFRADLNISVANGPGLIYFPDSIDRWSTRLFPLPLDVRCIGTDPREVSTPYLDAQINVPLLLLCAAFLLRFLSPLNFRQRLRAGGFLALPLLYTLLALGFSISPFLSGCLPRLFAMIQFAYRWVSFINLGLLAVFLFAAYFLRCRATPSAAKWSISPVALGLVLLLAGIGVAIKMRHALGECMGGPPTQEAMSRPFLSRLPFPGFGRDYTTPRRLTPVLGAGEPSYIPFDFDGPGSFCRPTPRSILMEQPGYVATQVAVFPWSRFRVDGRPVPEAALRSWPNGRFSTEPAPCVAVPVPAGEHVVEYSFVPDPMWRGFHRLSTVVFASWAAAVVGLSALRLVGRRTFGRKGINGSKPSGPPAPIRAAA